MSTPAQIDANRSNAILSTGPRSEAGKSTVSRNAVSHGLSSESTVLACEDQIAFEDLLEGIVAEFVPRGDHEFFLVHQMAEARWRLARIRRIEAAAFNSLLGAVEPASADARLAEALTNKGGDLLAKLDRYAASADRCYYKAHKELIAAVKARRVAETPAQTKSTDRALLDLLLKVPEYKTKPNSAAVNFDNFDEDELDALTRPVIRQSPVPDAARSHA